MLGAVLERAERSPAVRTKAPSCVLGRPEPGRLDGRGELELGDGKVCPGCRRGARCLPAHAAMAPVRRGRFPFHPVAHCSAETAAIENLVGHELPSLHGPFLDCACMAAPSLVISARQRPMDRGHLRRAPGTASGRAWPPSHRAATARSRRSARPPSKSYGPAFAQRRGAHRRPRQPRRRRAAIGRRSPLSEYPSPPSGDHHAACPRASTAPRRPVPLR